MAIDRELARPAVSNDERREQQSARLEALVAAHWSAATSGADPVAAGVVRGILTDYSKLWGLDAATRVALAVGITESEFAERAVELLAVTGDAPLRELARVPEPPPRRWSIANRTAGRTSARSRFTPRRDPQTPRW